MGTVEGSCSGCTRRWTSLRLAHCANCHRSFSGAWTFDVHRHMGSTDNERGVCIDPEEITSLELRDDKVWHRRVKEHEQSRKQVFHAHV